MNRNEIIGKRIVTARDLKDMQAKELAEKLGISATRLSNWENATSGINADFIFRISEILGVTSDYLLGLTDDPSEVFKTHLDSVSTLMTVRSLRRLNSQGQEKVATYADDLDKSGQYRADKVIEFEDVREIYTVGSAAAGLGAYNDGYYDDPPHIVKSEDIPKHDKAIDIRGTSMEPTIMDGAIAYLVNDSEIRNGRIYSVTICDVSYVKRPFIEGDSLILRSDSPDVKDLVFTGSDLETLRIEGRVVGWTVPKGKGEVV